MGKGEDVGEEGGYRGRVMCRQCSEGVVESLRHMLCECGGYGTLRGSWWDSVEPIMVDHGWGYVDSLGCY